MRTVKLLWIGTMAVAWTIPGEGIGAVTDFTFSQPFALQVTGDAGAGPFSRATAANASGEVVGYYRVRTSTGGDSPAATSRGFTANPPYASATRIPGADTYSRLFPWGVNNAGVIVGSARQTARSPLYPFYATPSTAVPGLTGGYGEAKGVQNSLTTSPRNFGIVGYMCPSTVDCRDPAAGAGSPTAFYFNPGTDTAATSGFPNWSADASQANAINDQGTIAGTYTLGGHTHALRYDWNSRSGEDLNGYLQGAISSQGNAINAAGDVAGTAAFADFDRAFVVAAGGKSATLLDPESSFVSTAAAGIADDGVVVGTMCKAAQDCGRFDDLGDNNPQQGKNAAMLWIAGANKAFNLTAVSGASTSGWTELSFAESVTKLDADLTRRLYGTSADAYLITGVGYFGAERRAFALTAIAVPEPRATALLAAGMLVLGLAHLVRRRG